MRPAALRALNKAYGLHGSVPKIERCLFLLREEIARIDEMTTGKTAFFVLTPLRPFTAR
jgi:hypothetical protein